MPSGTLASYSWVGVPGTGHFWAPNKMFRHLQRTTGSTMWTECEGLYLRSSFHTNLCWIKERQPHHFSARPRRERNPWLITPHPLHASRGCGAVPDTWLYLLPRSAPTHLPIWALCPAHHACADLWRQTGSFPGSQSARHASGCSSTVLSLSLTLSFPLAFFFSPFFPSFFPSSLLPFLPSLPRSFFLSLSFFHKSLQP